MKPKTVGRVTDGHYSPLNAQELCHGFPVGTPILTATGELPVEFLSAGDRIVTRNGGMTELLAINATTHATQAVKVSAAALGADMPAQDVLLPADQPALVRDWRAKTIFGTTQAITPIGHVADGTMIKHVGVRRLVLFRLTFDRPRVIYAAGLELGTDPAVNKPLRTVA